MDNIEFLAECEQRCRAVAANVNPCADKNDKIKNRLLARADQFKDCAEQLFRLKSLEE